VGEGVAGKVEASSGVVVIAGVGSVGFGVGVMLAPASDSAEELVGGSEVGDAVSGRSSDVITAAGGGNVGVKLALRAPLSWSEIRK
jgi:hypothetical protein